MVEPQTMSSILGASKKWFIIPAVYILVEGQCDGGVYLIHEISLFIPTPGKQCAPARKMRFRTGRNLAYTYNRLF